MIVFRNPGLIDLDTVRTMGVNVKVHANAFGTFGTGMKFGIATVLRGGGSVTIHRGRDVHVLSSVQRTIRDTEFELVCLDGEPIGFTTELGKNWEPWMVFREFGCNALDEQGEFFLQTDEMPDVASYPQDDWTTIMIEWDELDAAYEDRTSIFCAAFGYEQIMATPQVQVLEGGSPYLFYRGIRAYKLERPSVVTYNILSQQTLSEDRNIAHFYYPMGEIRRLWLECTDKEILRRVLVPEGDVFEMRINYLDTQREPTREFLDVVLDARTIKELKGRINESAVKVLHKSIRSSKESGVGYSSSRYMQDEFGEAMEAIAEIFGNDELKLSSLQMVLVEEDEVREDSLAMLEDGRLYIARPLLKKGRREVAATVLPLILELRSDSLEELIELVTPVLLRSHSDLRESKHNLPLDLDRDPEPEPAEEEDVGAV